MFEAATPDVYQEGTSTFATNKFQYTAKQHSSCTVNVKHILQEF